MAIVKYPVTLDLDVSKSLKPDIVYVRRNAKDSVQLDITLNNSQEIDLTGHEVYLEGHGNTVNFRKGFGKVTDEFPAVVLPEEALHEEGRVNAVYLSLEKDGRIIKTSSFILYVLKGYSSEQATEVYSKNVEHLVTQLRELLATNGADSSLDSAAVGVRLTELEKSITSVNEALKDLSPTAEKISEAAVMAEGGRTLVEFIQSLQPDTDTLVTKELLESELKKAVDGITDFATKSYINDALKEYRRKDEPITLTSSQIASLKGERGEVGPAGPQGPQGLPGAVGPKGADGKDGARGERGERGMSAYEVWAQSNSGDKRVYLASLKGPKGDTGAPGAKGEQGAVGPRGATGPQGKSAYEIWQDLGGVGSEQDFIDSLKGAGGGGESVDLSEYLRTAVASRTFATKDELNSISLTPGPTGPQGPAGPKGDTGQRGPQGDVGPAGQQGPAGAKGDTGPQGPRGETGPAGPAGPQGLQGINGAPGPAGPKGADGKSAYDLARENGFTGSLSEWLESLKGADGRDGGDTIDLSSYTKVDDFQANQQMDAQLGNLVKDETSKLSEAVTSRLATTPERLSQLSVEFDAMKNSIEEKYNYLTKVNPNLWLNASSKALASSISSHASVVLDTSDGLKVVKAGTSQYISLLALNATTKPIIAGQPYTVSFLTSPEISTMRFYLNPSTGYRHMTANYYGNYIIHTITITPTNVNSIAPHVHAPTTNGWIYRAKLEEGEESTLVSTSDAVDGRLRVLEDRLDTFVPATNSIAKDDILALVSALSRLTANFNYLTPYSQSREIGPSESAEYLSLQNTEGFLTSVNAYRTLSVSCEVSGTSMSPTATGRQRVGISSRVDYTDGSVAYHEAWTDSITDRPKILGSTLHIPDGKDIKSVTGVGIHIQAIGTDINVKNPKVEVGMVTPSVAPGDLPIQELQIVLNKLAQLG